MARRASSRPPSERGIEYQLLDAIVQLNERLDQTSARLEGLVVAERADVAAVIRELVAVLANHPNARANLEAMIESRLERR